MLVIPIATTNFSTYGRQGIGTTVVKFNEWLLRTIFPATKYVFAKNSVTGYGRDTFKKAGYVPSSRNAIPPQWTRHTWTHHFYKNLGLPILNLTIASPSL